MQADKLISSRIESIHPEESGVKALEMMDVFRVIWRCYYLKTQFLAFSQ